MFKSVNPDTISKPRRKYVHSIEIPAEARVLSASGQVGVAADGTVPEGIEAQTDICWHNVVEILKANDMEVKDIFKVVQYLTRVEDRDAHFVVRDRYLGDHSPTSTLLFISALAEPNFIVEVEVMAAKVD